MTQDKIYTAAQLSSGEKATVLNISGKSHLKKRLLDMGVLPGTHIQMIRHAPLGDPIDIKVKGCHISLRKSEAAHITVKKADEPDKTYRRQA